MKEVVENVRSFINRCVRVLKIMKKPDREEIKLTVKITLAGMAMIGIIGFAIFAIFALIGPYINM